MSDTASVTASVEEVGGKEDARHAIEAKRQAWRDRLGREVFVGPEAGGVDVPWGAFRVVSRNGFFYLRRLSIPLLQYFPSRVEAQRCLDKYARQNGWTEIPTCRKCGCTESRGCPGGCFWVEDDLCSRCAPDGVDEKCPFCHVGMGEIEEVSPEDIVPIAYAVVCEECGAQGPMAVTPEAAVACWKSRERV